MKQAGQQSDSKAAGDNASRTPVSAQATASEQPVQALVGNMALQALFARGGLAISQPDDPGEREADRVADQVCRHTPLPEPPQITGRTGGLQRKAEPGAVRPARANPVGGLLSSPGRPLPASTQSHFEARFGQDLSDVRVHAGSEAAQAATHLHARAFTHHNNIAFAAGQYAPDSASGRKILAHELTHVLQHRYRPTAAGVSRLPDGPVTDAFVERMGRLYYEQAQREAATHARWSASRAAEFHGALRGQNTTQSGEIASTQAMLGQQRVAMLGEFGDADLQSAWASARQAVVLVNTDLQTENYSDVDVEGPRQNFADFYTYLIPFASRTEDQQQEQAGRERQRYEADMETWRAQQSAMNSAPIGEPGERAFRAGMAISFPRPSPPYTAPASVLADLRTRQQRVYGATTDAEWRAVLQDFASSTAAMDNMLVYRVPASSDTRQGFEYYQGLLQRQQQMQEQHPDAVRIAAVFFPRDEFVDVRREDGETANVAKAIPWQFYLYRTDTEWVLKDLMSPRSAENRQAISAADQQRIAAGEEVDPPLALFEQLNTAIRFPEGILNWTMPVSGVAWRLTTTAEWSLSTWLTAIGIALAALGLILMTAGAATAPVAFGLAAVAGIGSTLADWQEKSEQGMLTDRDLVIGGISIAADLASIFTLGLGKLATVSAQAGSRLAQASLLAGRYLFRARAADLAVNLVQVFAVTGDFLSQYNALKDNTMLSEEDRDSALRRLLLTGIITGGVMLFGVVGGARDLGAGPGGRVRLDVDEAGRPRLDAEGTAGTVDQPPPVAPDLPPPSTPHVPESAAPDLPASAAPELPAGAQSIPQRIADGGNPPQRVRDNPDNYYYLNGRYHAITPGSGSGRVSRRLQYMGATPDKYSRTGREVLARMRSEGRIRGSGELTRGSGHSLEVLASDGNWYPIDETIDMAHLHDAVTWWNEVGRYHGARSRPVRDFMLDSGNYEFQPRSINRSEGAQLGETYLPPVAPDLPPPSLD